MFESEKEVSVLSSVYGEENLAKEQARYEHLATKFKECFGEGEVDFFSAPGSFRRSRRKTMDALRHE